MKRLYFYYLVDKKSQFVSLLCHINPHTTPSLSYNINFNSTSNIRLGLIILSVFQVSDKIIHVFVTSFILAFFPIYRQVSTCTYFIFINAKLFKHYGGADKSLALPTSQCI